MSNHFEPFSEERAKLAKERAERVFSGQYNGMEEAIEFLKMIISRHYSLPIFSEYFAERTLDDLLFETELIRLQTVPADVQKSEVIKNNATQAHELFDDMVAEDDIPNDFKDIAMDFMKTGNFKGD